MSLSGLTFDMSSRSRFAGVCPFDGRASHQLFRLIHERAAQYTPAVSGDKHASGNVLNCALEYSKAKRYGTATAL